VLEGVEVVVAVGLHPPPAADQGVLHGLHGLVGTPCGSKPVCGVWAVGLAEGLHHTRARRLPHPIPDRGNPPWAWRTGRFWPGPAPPRGRVRSPRPQVVPDLFRKWRASVAFHRLAAHALTPGRAAGGAPLLPGPPPAIGPDDAVIPRLAPAIPAPLGRSVASALAFS
jgi:hypothetical protein